MVVKGSFVVRVNTMRRNQSESGICNDILGAVKNILFDIRTNGNHGMLIQEVLNRREGKRRVIGINSLLMYIVSYT